MAALETVDTNTFYIAAQPVYLATDLVLALTEPTSAIKTPGTVTVHGGAFTTEEFGVQLASALNAGSPNSLAYTVTIAPNVGATPAIPAIPPPKRETTPPPVIDPRKPMFPAVVPKKAMGAIPPTVPAIPPTTPAVTATKPYGSYYVIANGGVPYTLA